MNVEVVHTESWERRTKSLAMAIDACARGLSLPVIEGVTNDGERVLKLAAMFDAFIGGEK